MCDEEDETNMTETQKAMAAARRKAKEEEAVWFEEYMVEVEERRAREEEELAELRERIAERRGEREEEEAQRQEYAELAAERYRQEEEDRKAKHEEAKNKKKLEREKKQAMMAGGMMPALPQPKKRAFKSKKKAEGEEADGDDEENQEEALGKAEAAHAAAKGAYMQKYSGPIEGLDEMDTFALRMRVKALHQQMVDLEMAKYDLECRTKIQKMDLNELSERKKQQLRQKAMKQGLDPEEFANAKHPQKIKTQNAYDRVIDARGFVNRKDYFLQAPPPAKAVAHGSGRPPVDWGRTFKTEEIENVRKHLEENPPKYQELEPVEGAKPPVPVIKMAVPAEDEVAPAPPPAAEPAPEEVAA